MADESGDKLSKLYDVLSKDKKYKFSGDADAFAQRFSDPEKLGKLYDVLAKDPKYKIATKKDEWVSQFNQGLKKKESSESSGQSGTSASQTTSLPDIGKVVSEYKEHPLPLSPDQLTEKWIKDANAATDVHQLHQKIQNHTKENNYYVSNAISDVNIAKYPQDDYPHRVKAHNYMQTGQPSAAYDELSEAIKLKPNDYDLYKDRALVGVQALGEADQKAKDDAYTYIYATDKSDGDIEKAKNLALMYKVVGDEANYQKWNLAQADMAKSQGKTTLPVKLEDFNAWLYQNSDNPIVQMGEGFRKPFAMANEQATQGLKTIYDNLPSPNMPTPATVTEKIPNIISGGLEAGMGFLGLTNPEMIVFNATNEAAQMVGANALVDVLTAPITSAYKFYGGNVDNLNAYAKIGFTLSDMAMFGVYYGLMKGGFPEIAQKIITKEPLTKDEAGVVVKEADKLTPQAIDESMAVAKTYVDDAKAAEEVKNVAPYSIGSQAYTDPQKFLEALQKIKETYDANGSRNYKVKYNVAADDATKQKADELFKKEVKDARGAIGLKDALSCNTARLIHQRKNKFGHALKDFVHLLHAIADV